MFCVTLPCFAYTFRPIWTNLLTQCTQLPVPIFCCFCISGFPAIKSAPKNPEKSYKKSAFRKPPESPKEGRGATTGTPEGSLARPHPRLRRAPSWLSYGPSRFAASPIFSPHGGNPEDRSAFRNLSSVLPLPPFQDQGCL